MHGLMKSKLEFYICLHVDDPRYGYLFVSEIYKKVEKVKEVSQCMDSF